jgi:2-polyprenyl-6-methoxyphenol hydroxylase-like FAD-dependent oxidoreductase
VGAGPTGLTLANELARYGVAFRIVDKAPFVSQHTKALGVQARTLELMERLGVAGEMVGRGLPVTAFNILSELRQIACFDPGGIPSRYPYLLMLPQNEVEEILRDRLAAQGHTVGYGTEVMTFTQDRDGVRVQLRDQQGRPQDTTVAWLVGCDGAHSLVRYQLGVAFEGEAFEQRFAMADVRVAWPLPGDEVFAFLNRGNFMAFFPMAGGLHRVAIAHPAAAEPDGSVSVAELQESLDRNGPTGARITDVAWTSRFRINQRKASRQSAGRVFLTGTRPTSTPWSAPKA